MYAGRLGSAKTCMSPRTALTSEVGAQGLPGAQVSYYKGPKPLLGAQGSLQVQVNYY